MSLLVMLSVIGLLAVSAIDAWRTRGVLLEDRQVKTQHVVDVAYSVIANYYAQVQAGTLDEAAAKKAAMAELETLRYGGNDYFWINDLTPVMLMHPFSKKLVGQNIGGMKDKAGKLFFQEMVDVVKRDGAGFVQYDWAKPDSETAVPKISYVKGFKEWGWIVGSGIYIDDVNAIFWNIVLVQGGILLGILALVILVSMAIANSISRPLMAATASMKRLSEGDKTIEVHNTELKSEIGELARALEVFKQNALEMDRLAAEQEALKKRAEADRRQAMLDMADKFEASVSGVVNAVTAAATELQATAQSLSETAEEASQQSNAVAETSGQMTQNVQTVAAATEELSASIREIGNQVTESSRIVGAAVNQAEDTNAKVKALAEAAQKIGDVVTLINEIAGQTNLLALNATIEAARAGEAGKGFAVVASEVKNLATQTAKATEEISGQIRAIQDATASSAQAIDGITQTIGRVNEISTAIASAVEEQGAATQEISRNVQEASAGSAEVSTNIVGVTQASQQTSAGSTEVLSAASELARNGEKLRQEVEAFLHTVRAA
ncbi:MAG TPA: cache domain-containing protein [Alphaproteobacteria bacterium]|nr:cache domain-containing protein [Alphaproteobacteria bacterium]